LDSCAFSVAFAAIGGSLWLSLLGLSLLACAAQPEAPPERVLLITVDTLRADHVGVYGADGAHTPQMDTIAAGGVRFDAAISPAPLTLPTHATLFTGLEPPAHGVRHNGVHSLPEEIPTLAEQLSVAGYATAAVVGALVLDRRFGLARGFDHYDDRMGSRRSDTVGYPERRAEQVVDAALAWLAVAPERFFLWVHFYDPHAGYDPPRGFASAFANRPYAGEIAYVDAQIGRLLEGLRGRFGGEGLLVALTSDHGESLGEHREWTHGYGVYDATQRVPLIVNGPGVPAGAVISRVVGLADLAPTLLARARAAPLPGASGRDLLAPDGDETSADRPAYVETLATQIDFQWSPLLGVRSASHKYVRAPRPELYDLVADPHETRNLAAERPELAAQLDRALESHRAGARAPHPVTGIEESDRALLRALGYVAPTVVDPSLSLGEVGGPDPKDEMDSLRTMVEAETALTAGRPREALALLLPLGEAGDVGAAVSALRAAAAIGAADPIQAERDSRAVLAAEPGRADALILLGRALEGQGRFADAGVAYRAEAGIDRRSAAGWTGFGRSLEQLGRRGEAAEAYGKALERVDPTRAEASWRLAALEIEMGRQEPAADRLRSLGAGTLAEPAVAIRLAYAEHRAGRPDRARDRLSEARRRHPDHPILIEVARLIESAANADSVPSDPTDPGF
jgi:choline-sulfatase